MSERADDFAGWLAGALADRGWRQRELAVRSGVSQQTVSRWLLGQTRPSARHARRLAATLEVPPDEILERLDAPPSRGPFDAREAELAALRARVERLESELARRRA